MKLFQELIKLLNKYKSRQIEYHLHGKNIDLTGDNVTISSNNFNVDSNGNMSCNNANISGTITATSGTFNGVVNASSGSFNGTVTATSGTFDNCTVRDNCTVAGNSINSNSSNRINNLYVSRLDTIVTFADAIGLNNEHQAFSVGDYAGQTVKIPVPISITVNSSGQVTAQTWRRLVFKGGILVEVQDNW